MLSYVPVSRCVPQGLESFMFNHLIFPVRLWGTEHNVWWPLECETKWKGWFTQITFTSFVPLSTGEIVPMNSQRASLNIHSTDSF